MERKWNSERARHPGKWTVRKTRRVRRICDGKDFGPLPKLLGRGQAEGWWKGRRDNDNGGDCFYFKKGEKKKKK